MQKYFLRLELLLSGFLEVGAEHVEHVEVDVIEGVWEV